MDAATPKRALREPTEAMPLGWYELGDPGFVTPEEACARPQHVPEEFRVFTTGEAVGWIEAAFVEEPSAHQCVARVQITSTQRLARCMTTPCVKSFNIEPRRHDLFESRQYRAKRTVAGIAFDELQILRDPVFVCDFVVIDEQDPLARRF